MTITCHAQASDGSCVAPQIFDVSLVGDRFNVSRIETPSVYDVYEMPGIDVLIVYRDDDYALMYGCGALNVDGSCVSDETSVTLVSRQRNAGKYRGFLDFWMSG